MEKLKTFEPIIGDDLGYHTILYQNVPKGYGFDALVFPEDRPLAFALKDKLISFASEYYSDWEIVGNTFSHFKSKLQMSLDLNLDTMEKMLEVYQDDIAKPTQSRTIKRTYDISDTTDITGNAKNTGTVSSTITNTDFDIPVDNPNGQATNKSDSDGTTTNDLTNTTSGKTQFAHKGTETEDWSDVGVAPNYELLNGFLDNNRTYYDVFVNFFKDDFQLTEGWYL